ncbi:hypothetical protein ACFW04_005126 [Cataglyphis niger]
MGFIPFIPFENQSQQHEDEFMADDEIFTENRNEMFRLRSHMFFTPTLEDLKNVLYVALNPYFEEFEIAIVSCPCLTRAPYNLAAAGLSGNTGILKLGSFNNFRPRPQTNYAYDIDNILSSCNYDAFVIGSGFAAKPIMPYNGHLTMNAVVSANPTNVINNSCIANKAPSTHQRRLEIINDYNQIKCSIHGNFFYSEGKRGPVIKIRVKGRRSRSSIIALIQAALTNRCPYKIIGIGIVLVINGGRVTQYLLPDDYVEYDYNDVYKDYFQRTIGYRSNCKNLIALGTLMSNKLLVSKNHNGKFFESTFKFNSFSNYKSIGEFFNDATPKKTEYIAYLNIAQELYRARRF